MNRQTDNQYDRQAELSEKKNIYELVTGCLPNKYSTLNQIKKSISTQSKSKFYQCISSTLKSQCCINIEPWFING